MLKPSPEVSLLRDFLAFLEDRKLSICYHSPAIGAYDESWYPNKQTDNKLLEEFFEAIDK